MQLGTLIAFSPYPGANAFEVFKRNTASGAFRNVYELLADVVVNIFGKAFLFAGEFLQAAFRGLRTFLLQAFPLSSPSLSDRINPVSGETVAVGGGGDVGYPQIYADKFLNVIRRGFVNIAGGEKVENAVNQYQVAFAALGVEQLQLPLAGEKGNGLAAFNRPNTHRLPACLPREDTIVVGECAGEGKGALCFAVEFVGVGDFGDGTHHHLRREGILFPQRFVDKTVDGELFEGLLFPRPVADVIARGVGGFQGFKQDCVLLWGWLQFYFRRQSHNMIILERSV